MLIQTRSRAQSTTAPDPFAESEGETPRGRLPMLGFLVLSVAAYWASFFLGSTRAEGGPQNQPTDDAPEQVPDQAPDRAPPASEPLPPATPRPEGAGPAKPVPSQFAEGGLAGVAAVTDVLSVANAQSGSVRVTAGSRPGVGGGGDGAPGPATSSAASSASDQDGGTGIGALAGTPGLPGAGPDQGAGAGTPATADANGTTGNPAAAAGPGNSATQPAAPPILSAAPIATPPVATPPVNGTGTGDVAPPPPEGGTVVAGDAYGFAELMRDLAAIAGPMEPAFQNRLVGLAVDDWITAPMTAQMAAAQHPSGLPVPRDVLLSLADDPLAAVRMAHGLPAPVLTAGAGFDAVAVASFSDAGGQLPPAPHVYPTEHAADGLFL